MKRTGLPPGIILRKEFLEPFGLTPLAVAEATGIPQSRLSDILAGKRAISADTAARLGRYFGVDPRNWLNLHTSYDLQLVEQSEAKALKKDKPASLCLRFFADGCWKKRKVLATGWLFRGSAMGIANRRSSTPRLRPPGR